MTLQPAPGPLLVAVLVTGLTAVLAQGEPQRGERRRAPGGERKLTLEQVGARPGAERPDLASTAPRWRWAHDGVHLTRALNGGREAWIDPVTGTDVRPNPRPDEDDRRERRLALEIEQAISDGGARGYSQRTIARIAKRLASDPEQTSDDGSARMAYIDGELWFHGADTGARVLERGANGELRYDTLAPDGRSLSFVRDNDLYLVDTETGRRRAVTSDGGPDQFNGVLDWVYQEEIYGRGDFRGSFWSPSGEHIAFLSLDESPVHEFTVVDHIEDGHFRVKPEVTHYPKVGDPNPEVSVGIATPEPLGVVWVDLSAYEGREILVVRVGWTPDGSRCLVHVQDRIQTWADLLSVDPETGEGRVLIHEGSDAWTERPEPPIWLTDGTFLWHSHRTGTMHLYRYRMDGTLLGAVTEGEWNLRSVVHVSEDQGPGEPVRGHVWFDGTDGGDIDSNLFRVALDGTGYRRLTSGRGTHEVRFNDDRTMFVDRWSSLTHPGGVRLCDADGNVLRELGRAEVPADEEYALGRWELHRVALEDGVELDVALMKPKDFDPERRYGVWVSTYSGPAAPSVRNRWSANAFHHFLTQNGFVVLQANVRTATSRGAVHTAALYRRVGLQEVSDMVAVVDWLTAHPWADGTRVGITGYSFGGTMTANCLLRSDRFKLGIAGGGVYDWRMYDTIYTERYMRTPTDNLSGYEATSVLAQAKNLRDECFLHMHHGLMDDNVHVQNLFRMSDALMQAGKTNWSMMAYPRTRHGIRDPEMRWHELRVRWDLIREHLSAPGKSARSAAAGSH